MYKYPTVRVGIVGYRDLTLTPRFEVQPLTLVTRDDATAVKDFIKKIKFTTNVSQDFAEVRASMELPEYRRRANSLQN